MCYYLRFSIRNFYWFRKIIFWHFWCSSTWSIDDWLSMSSAGFRNMKHYLCLLILTCLVCLFPDYHDNSFSCGLPGCYCVVNSIHQDAKARYVYMYRRKSSWKEVCEPCRVGRLGNFSLLYSTLLKKICAVHQQDQYVKLWWSGVALRPRRPGSVFTPNLQLQYAPNVGWKETFRGEIFIYLLLAV